MKLITGNSNIQLAQSIADYCDIPLTKASVRRFADEEIFVEIHFEDKNKSVFEEKIELESTDLEWFEWSGAKSIRYTGSVLVNDNNVVDILKERLIFLNAEIGDQVRLIIKGESNYWIFQGNPKVYDVVSALKDNALKSWSRH